MAVGKDPERNEIAALLEYAGDLSGKHVLEVGAGDGRLTWRYAAQAARVTGIDPDSGEIALAVANTPQALEERVTFQVVDINDFESDHVFDLAILAWSL